MGRETHYEILRLSPCADFQEVKKAYRRLSLDYHPDRGGSPSDFIRIRDAYEYLKDPGRKSRYDRTIPKSDFKKQVTPLLAEGAIYLCILLLFLAYFACLGWKRAARAPTGRAKRRPARPANNAAVVRKAPHAVKRDFEESDFTGLAV